MNKIDKVLINLIMTLGFKDIYFAYDYIITTILKLYRNKESYISINSIIKKHLVNVLIRTIYFIKLCSLVYHNCFYLTAVILYESKKKIKKLQIKIYFLEVVCTSDNVTIALHL